MTATDLFKAGQLSQAIDAQLKEVKANPADQGRRLFLFELLAFSGDLDRAQRQIDAVDYKEMEKDVAVLGYKKALAAEKDKVACYTISLDLPFAQKRFCAAENVSNMQTLSDTHDHSFGENYGVLIEGLPLPLLSRAIFVVDKTGTITYAEYVPEVPQHPNYEKALAALKALA